MSKRKKPTLTERYASVLLTLKWGDGRPLIDREAAKHLTAGEIVEQFEHQVQFDHGIHVAIDGTNHPTNLTPRLTADHREKTNKIDIPQIAKTKRIAKAQSAHEAVMAEKFSLAPSAAKMATKGRRKWATRTMPGTKKSGLRKRLNGKVERRVIGAGSS